MKHLINKGKEISYLLRHNPEGLIMDSDGYVNVTDLLKKTQLTKDELDWIVENNDKKRFSYSSDDQKIRASQGHSIDIDIKFKETVPPVVLFHGTTPQVIGVIMKFGLQKMQRHHVHMTDNIKTAEAVGKRYSKKLKPIVLEINCKAMYADGFKFYLSDNGVWLTDNVPPKYLDIL